jgi:hypothetical protein
MPTDGEADSGAGAGEDGGSSPAGPTDEEVVEVASDAAEDVLLSRLSKRDLDDVDVSVTFDDGVLDVDVYVHAPDARADEDRVAEDAALAAQSAVDDLF